MDDDSQLQVSNRHAVLSALSQILDARSLETLFSGPPAEAALLYDVLEEAAKGVQSSYYWEICRTARRRQLTPAFVIDRVAVLLASIHERRKWDLYRLLEVPPLSSIDAIHQRFRELAKVEHPDMGGDGVRFRRLKEAYEILKDDGRRSEYEAFWVRALGPFERTQVMPAVATETTTAPGIVTEVTQDAAVDHAQPPPVASPGSDLSERLRQIAALLRQWDERTFPGTPPSEPPGRVVRLAAGLRSLTRSMPADLDDRRANVEQLLARCVRLRGQLDTIASLKTQLANAGQ